MRLPSVSPLQLLLLLATAVATVSAAAVPSSREVYSAGSGFINATLRCSAEVADLALRTLGTRQWNEAQRVPAWSLTALCPANCTDEAATATAADASSATSLSRPVLYGSFPYHPSSSVCLAAIHAGLIRASVGGGVFISRFHSHDWSGTSNQTIFPFNSSRGSLSNGVQSLDVPDSWHSVPSDNRQWSFTVRGIGDVVMQRRQAPWPARSNHLQLVVPGPRRPLGTDGKGVWAGHTHLLIAGGYNGSAYLNDVYVGTLQTGGPTFRDWQWRRLPDAPWSPRADMMVRSVRDALMMVVGGQTGHCQLYELGVCSAEAWGMNVTTAADGSFDLQWSAAPLFELPFHPRCGAALFSMSMQNGSGVVDDALLVVAGQESYPTNDSACSTQPVTTNSVMGVDISSTEGRLTSPWTPREPAPFSARRFARADSCADAALYPASAAQVADAYNGYSSWCTAGAGIVHRALIWDAAGRARLSSSEVFSDGYRRLCDLVRFPVDAPCQWDLTGAVIGFVGGRHVYALPAPVDTEGQSILVSARLGGVRGLMIGGRTSARFLAEWQRTMPRMEDRVGEVDVGQLAINLTLTYVTDLEPTTASALETAMVEISRMRLPLSAALDEAELNAEGALYERGSDWLVTSLDLASDTNKLTRMSTMHHQPRAFVDSPAELLNTDGWFTPLAASTLNTSRPRLNFDLQRHSHATSQVSLGATELGTDAMLVVTTGGRSGSEFFSDVVALEGGRCLPPVDPMYWESLGPGLRMRAFDYDPVHRWYTDGYGYQFADDGAFTAGTTYYVHCVEGAHLEPPSGDSQWPVTCMANGMWMDFFTQSIRRCVLNQLNCSLPLQDLGSNYCEPALPLITRISAAPAGAAEGGQAGGSGRNVDPVTLVDVPLTSGLRLSIRGNAFFRPLQVRVGEFPCAEPTLEVEGTGRAAVVAYNFTSTQGGTRLLIEGTWGDLITCTLPAVLGAGLYVGLTSGIIGEQTEVNMHLVARLASLTSTAPVLTRLSANTSHCRQQAGAPLSLFDCVNAQPFPVQVCAARDSIGGGEFAQTAVLALEQAQQPLSCSRWSPVGGDDEMCTECLVYPHLNSAWLRVLQPDLPRLISQQLAIISFRSCAPGTRVDAQAAAQSNASSICIACPAGSSSFNAASMYDCAACLPGSYSSEEGWAVCRLCPPGAYAPSAGAAACPACPLNSYANTTGRASCETCELNEYLVPVDEAQVGISGRCAKCPDDASCAANGSISAAAGAYLLVDQAASTVSTTTCAWQACVDASLHCPYSSSSSSSSADAAPTIARSGLPVINCCGEGRYPAYSASSSSPAFNVLCAQCLPGYSQVAGRCIPCSSIDVGALLGVLLLAFALLYCVHRMPHDWSGSATFLLLSTFLQLSALLLQSQSLPHLASLLNVALDNSVAGVCIAPMDDAQRIGLQLASPLIAFAMLACLGLLQLGARASLRCLPPRSPWWYRLDGYYRLLFHVWTPHDYAPGQRVQPEHSSSRSGSALQLDHALLSSETGSTAVDDGQAKPSDASGSSGAQLRLSAGAAVRSLRSTTASLSFSTSFPSSASSSSSSLLGYQRTGVRLLLLSYTGLCSLTLQCFHWQAVGDFGFRLLHFPTISPDSSAYRSLQPALIVALVLVVCCLPLALAVYLLVEHRLGAIAQVKRQQLRHSLPMQQQQQSTGAQVDAHPRVDVSLALQLSRPRAALLLQLTAMYRAQCWWMGSFALVRRLLLVALLVSLRSPAVWIWLTLANYLLLLLHTLVQPYERVRDNQLETLTLTSLSVQTSLLSAYPPPYLDAGLLAAFNALVVIPVLPLLLELGQRWCGRSREKWAYSPWVEDSSSPPLFPPTGQAEADAALD